MARPKKQKNLIRS